MTTVDSGATAIEVESLRVDYGAVRAVDGLTFRVSRGEIYALLGPNGAGKTTTVEVLEGHRRRTGGKVLVLGEDPRRARRAWRERVGIVLQSGGLEAELTVAELVRLYASFYPRPRPVDATIEQVGLAGKRKARVLADRVGVLRHGRLIAESAPDTLAGRDRAKAVIAFRRPGMSLETMPDGPWAAPEVDGDRITITTNNPTNALFILTTWATSRGSELPALTVTRPSLEEAYLELTDSTGDRAGAG